MHRDSFEGIENYGKKGFFIFLYFSILEDRYWERGKSKYLFFFRYLCWFSNQNVKIAFFKIYFILTVVAELVSVGCAGGVFAWAGGAGGAGAVGDGDLRR